MYYFIIYLDSIPHLEEGWEANELLSICQRVVGLAVVQVHAVHFVVW